MKLASLLDCYASRYRKHNKLHNYRQLDIHASQTCYAFEIGTTLVVLSNVGSKANTECTFALPEDGPLPVAAGASRDAYLADALNSQVGLQE